MASVLISTLVLDPGCEQDREDPYSNGVEEKINGTYVCLLVLMTLQENFRKHGIRKCSLGND